MASRNLKASSLLLSTLPSIAQKQLTFKMQLKRLFLLVIWLYRQVVRLIEPNYSLLLLDSLFPTRW